jgi:hypothetical protein
MFIFLSQYVNPSFLITWRTQNCTLFMTRVLNSQQIQSHTTVYSL